ncbi:phosphatidate cytidylyltransferase [Chengkuizengella axinellae]|uniref:Phosphatidate cytidylyltransferase n=1 Tax=Chengkuizengella axinellae TaxID=3064388 RepID=A0ABT9IVT3_9BACL|nr:phosphatidate cytidylyltransferase [Chengkuizengella sp. 2205SS18-9]MDP5273474.1 phosphatidate cytidylyltransferase [Chengkuizengella sp. 2205SS18-9]
MIQRIVTGVLALALFLFFLFLGEIWFAMFMLLLSLVGYYEYVKITQNKVLQFSSILGFVSIIYFVVPWSELGVAFLASLSVESVIWSMLLLFFITSVLSKNKQNIKVVALLFLGAIYIGTGFHYMAATLFIENGLFWALFIFISIWLTDAGAYFSGLAFGKHPLWPSISPKKTIEGSIGGILITVIAAIAFAIFAPEIIELKKAITLAILISIFSQMGDLIQSAYKRVYNVKDSGKILPGHGGILDRCDSWIIVFPLLHIFQIL